MKKRAASPAKSHYRVTRMPPIWLEILNGVLLITWGGWMIAAIEPSNADTVIPWTRMESPRLCLAALMPLWAWGAIAMVLGVIRMLANRSVRALRLNSFLSFVFWTTVASLYIVCVPHIPSVTLYAYSATISFVTTIQASRRIGEDGAAK